MQRINLTGWVHARTPTTAQCPYDASRVSGDACKDLSLAVEELFALFGVEKLLDPQASKLDDRITTPYLVQVS